ncbi:D-alanine--D-alanine ligase [Mycobacterium sp. 2YAF39]|uniref:D-alanine--D-alanine ligase family protein n=1 Tax=Mycobacterium sp. 2YAF39 TaxID=3233033 RepID=UPI003F9D35D0
MAGSVLHLVGSPVDAFHAELSALYAGGCLAVLQDLCDNRVAYVSPGGKWQFPSDLSPAALADAPLLKTADAVVHLEQLNVSVAVPQMFCPPGMTSYRSLLYALDIPFVGNPASVMAVAADKAKTRAVVAAAGVRVPEGRVVRDETPVDLRLPVVVKPVGADNSVGVTLVRSASDYSGAVRAALAHGDTALVESYVELGREVRCGIIVRDGELIGLPLEEYAVNSVRQEADKLARRDDGSLYLVAKDDERAWIVGTDDPITEGVWEVARRAHEALGCRHYSLFDFRIDPNGEPWFLEAGLYCSFAPTSVIAVMAAAAGISVEQLFTDTVAELDREMSIA